MSPSPPPPVVLCPLEFERRVLRRAGLGRLARLACCGPGAAAVERWAGEHDAGTIVLCGLAGSLDEHFAAGSAWAAGAVLGDDGVRYEPPRPEPGGEGPTVASSPRTLTSPESKRVFAERTGAHLVDLESAAFARIAEVRGWDWAVVRGAGDGPETALPEEIDGWVDRGGRTRPGRVLAAVVRGRAGIGPLRRLRADGLAAMRAAAGITTRMLETRDG